MDSTRPLLIGQAPGPRTDPELPLFPVPNTSTGGRLKEIMGIRRYEYLRIFERINLLPTFPGQHKRDDKFPIASARLAAAAMRSLLAGRVVILVGRNVARAFGHVEEFHQWVDWAVRRPCKIARDNPYCRVAVIPHPSGRNHWYNDQANREAAQRFWNDFLRGERKVLSFDAHRGMS